VKVTADMHDQIVGEQVITLRTGSSTLLPITVVPAMNVSLLTASALA